MGLGNRPSAGYKKGQPAPVRYGFQSANESAASLGVHALVGTSIGVAPPGYEFPRPLLNRIRTEITPLFRPLWVSNHWRNPHGRIVIVGHHMLGTYAPTLLTELFQGTGLENGKAIRGLLLPIGRHQGIYWRHPIHIGPILDDLSDTERNQGVLPRYESPENDWLFWAMKRDFWEAQRRPATERVHANNESTLQRARKAVRAAKLEGNYRAKNDGLWDRKTEGLADSTFVSSTLLSPTVLGTEAVP